jgi:hypothetical protein
VELLVPLPNDRVERLGTKTEWFVGRDPAVLNGTTAGVVSSYVKYGSGKTTSCLVSPFKSNLL